MATLNLSDRTALLAIVREERRKFAEAKNVSVPQKLDQNAVNLLVSVAEYDADIDEADLRSKLGDALDAGAGKHFVNMHRVMKDLSDWIEPMKPAPAEPEGEEGGEEGEAAE